METPTLGVGIIGLGFMAVAHIKAYRQLASQGIQIRAICNPSGKKLDGDLSDVAGNIGGQDPIRLDMTEIAAYRDFSEMLKDPNVQCIDICTPTPTHLALAQQALKAGKHVLCEKPLARTSREAREISDFSRNTPGVFMPAMCLRFWPEWDYLKQSIADGRFGSLNDLRLRRVAQPPAWGTQTYFDGKLSGGALLDLHIHDTDFICYCLGKPKAVFSQGYSKHSGAIDHVLTQYLYNSKVVVSAEGSWCMTPGFGFNMAYTANFERATVDYDIGRGESALKVFEVDKDPQTLNLGLPDGYVGELQHWLESIRAGRATQVVTPEDAVVSIQVCEAEERSISSSAIESVE